VISLALNFDNAGPQGAKSKYPAMGRINPVHTMLRTGTDLLGRARSPRHPRRRRHGGDAAAMRHAVGGLGHVFYENSMWNGYDCREVTSNGAQKCGIEKTKRGWSAAACCSTSRARSQEVARRRLRHHRR